MRCRKCRSGLDSSIESLTNIHSPVSYAFSQGMAIDVFHYNAVPGCPGLDYFVDHADVRVREGRNSARLLLEPAQVAFILSEENGKELERNFALQPRILGEINFTHPSGSERRNNFVLIDCLTGNSRNLSLSKELRRYVKRRRLDEEFSAVFKGKERLNLAAQRFVARAGFSEKRFPFTHFLFQSRVIKLLYLLPPIRLHCVPRDLALSAATL